ncbi:MAG: DUF559 domain-containing protein [Balneolales bacterium]
MKKSFIPYAKHLKEKARFLRNNSAPSEILLWKHLKGKQMLGYDFHRQKPLDQFIVDFFCHDLMLVIEIDGESHRTREQEDLIRQNRLEQLGLEFLRFDDLEVKRVMGRVLEIIEDWIMEHYDRKVIEI